MLKESFNEGIEIGKKYGLVKGYKMWTDQHGMSGAIGAIVIFAGVIICLYLSAIVVGSMGTQVSSGGIVMSSRWNTTVSSLDTSASSAFSMANVLPIAIIGTSIMGIVIGAFAMR